MVRVGGATPTASHDDGPPPQPSFPSKGKALVMQGLALVAARKVVDAVREARATLRGVEGGGGAGSPPPPPADLALAKLDRLASTSVGRRAQTIALAEAARREGKGPDDARLTALRRVAEIAVLDQALELIQTAKEVRDA